MPPRLLLLQLSIFVQPACFARITPR